MSLQLPDDANFEAAQKAYFRDLRQKHKTQIAIAQASGLNRATIRKKFKNWGWDRDWVEPEEPAANSPPAAASVSSPASSAAPPKQHKANGHPSRDFLEPGIRAKLEAMKKKKRSRASLRAAVPQHEL